jgi:hypothetical protein
VPHHASLLSTRLLSAISAGSPERDGFGLTVIPLQVRGADAGRPQLAEPLAARELQVPEPRNVVMASAAGAAGLATFGQRLTGGMADRVVMATSAIPRGQNAIIPVAPLEPRWWDEGPLRLRGQLSPTLVALLQLAASDWIGLRSLARTALWEACRGSCDGALVAVPDSWALFDGRTLLAGRLMLAPAVSSRAPDSPPDPHSSALVRRALAEAAEGARFAWSAVSHPDLTELSMVRASLILPEAILRSPAVF